MTTSGVYSFYVTRDDIIRQAMLGIGKLGANATPTAVQTQDCAMMLNMMIKQWMGKTDFAPGLKVWTRKHGHLFLSNQTGRYLVGPGATGWTENYVYPLSTATVSAAGTVLTVDDVTGISAGYNVGIELDDGSLQWTTASSVNTGTNQITIPAPGLDYQSSVGNQIFAYQTAAQQPLEIETAVLRDQDLNDTPLNIMIVQDYDMLPNKANPTFIQDPTAIYYEFQLGNSYLYTDAGAAEDVTKHICLTYMQPVQDFVNGNDTPYYPQEWYLPLCLGLSKLICPMFNRVWTQLMQDNFNTALAIAQHKDPERSTMYFQCNPDG